MRHRSPLRLTSGSPRGRQFAPRATYLAMALLPSLWVSWQAPVVRGVVLPSLAILTLVLLLPRTAADKLREPEEQGTRPGSPFLQIPLRSDLTNLISSILLNPALLYLAWAVVCAARAAEG